MMPFYYGSRARSVPEYLKLRFDEKTRGFNACSFAVMTVFSSGISMNIMGKLFQALIGWSYETSICVSALIVLCYIFAGGLTSAIYNEVVQFFLIVFGLVPLVVLGLVNVGGWDGLQRSLQDVAAFKGLPEHAYTQSWANTGDPTLNPMGVEWFGLAMGLGFVLSFGYWCTDFLVVQRAMAADSMSAARRTPLIASVPKMLFPLIVIVPGMIALVVVPRAGEKPVAVADGAKPADPAVADADALPDWYSPDGKQASLISVDKDETLKKRREDPTKANHIEPDYNMAVPNLLRHYLPSGLLGLGITALLASFMSGMAGNVTALNTVWTCDIYQSYVNRKASDQHLLWMGRAATVVGIVLSVGAAYVARAFNNVMDMLQLVFAFVNAPLFGTFALGMFWRRTTGHGAFWGLVSGTAAAALHHGLTLPKGATTGIKGGFFGSLHEYPTEMSQGFWTAISAFTACVVVTLIVSLLTKPRADDELRGLVYALTPKAEDDAKTWWQRPAALAIIVLLLTLALNALFF
jgi:SSS family solute:Na+ symporter